MNGLQENPRPHGVKAMAGHKRKRARIVSGLVALAALVVAPRAEASLPHSSTAAREAPALS